jgi:ribonuclease Z
VFLGTSGSMPTPERGSASIAIKSGRDVILLDCGEGTQQRMVAAKVGFRRNMLILITHLHGDHVLGLPGLLQTMSLLGRQKSLNIYGPTGISDFLKCVSKSIGGPTFPVKVFEFKDSQVLFEGSKYEVRAINAMHSIEAYSFAFIEKPRPGRFHPEKARELGIPEGCLWGKLQRGESVRLCPDRVIEPNQVVDPPRRGRKIVYSGDTKPNTYMIKHADQADLLIHEATFDDSLLERAESDCHSTARQAAEIAKKACVRKLILTHISSRYPNPSIILQQARKVFPNTVVAEDLMEIIVPLID